VGVARRQVDPPGPETGLDVVDVRADVWAVIEERRVCSSVFQPEDGGCLAGIQRGTVTLDADPEIGSKALVGGVVIDSHRDGVGLVAGQHRRDVGGNPLLEQVVEWL